MALRRAGAAILIAALLTAGGALPVWPEGGAGASATPGVPAAPSPAAPGPVAPATGAVPCASPEYHQFDFWIGDWEVTTLDGKLAGWNLVQRELGGCMITESWTGARGARGRSMNAYSASDRHWHQVWMDSRGVVLDLSGGLVDGDMVMSGETAGPDGAKKLNRITWHRVDDDHLRQHWEQSSDGGASWTDVFLGIYARHKS